MDFLIVTGMSGAGKSLAANVLEDMGYYCVDNIPPALIPKFSEVCMQSGGRINKVAMIVDSRGGELFAGLVEGLEELRQRDNVYHILFLDCDDDVLVTRYKETRRKHPLCEADGLTVAQAIAREREMLAPARKRASYVVDTTLLTAAQLCEKIYGIFESGSGEKMLVNCESFGFKYGLPSEADLVFDVRCLPNPFYVPELKEHTGLEVPVGDYVMGFEQSRVLLDKLCDLLGYLTPMYLDEGKAQLTIAIGCTGGKHRSVLFAVKISEYLRQKGYRVACTHRDIAKVRR